ncbi:MAG: flagellar basal body P-ring protein FlgI [Sedimentisphaerales bacterium]|nr:flagellar basal body P-ring protein FlgI [Sedimentisphaerales bacterium]
MKTINFNSVYVMGIVFVVGLAGGCEDTGRSAGRSKLLAGPSDLGPTIGSLAKIYSPESAVVEGYGLVGGLRGTGSLECPPSLRAYLKRYILKQVPDQKINVEKLINSYNTAVVHVVGEVPSMGSTTKGFDVLVSALKGTQTTSLEGGWLYGAELRVAGGLAAGTGVVGRAAGPIFTDQLGDLAMSRKTGYVLGGAETSQEYRMSLVLDKPDFAMAGNVRNRINERFGIGIARAVTPGRIELLLPPRYVGQRQRFISLVEATYLTEDPEITAQRVLVHIKNLAISEDKHPSEIALEAIGNESLGKLRILLNSSDEKIRFHAARCMLNLGSDMSLTALVEIALRKDSALRIDAIEALATSASRNDAIAVCRRLLGDASFDIRAASFERLLRLDDPSVKREFIGRSFYLDQVGQSQYKSIFAYRSGEPRIVLIGAPILCSDSLSVQSEDGSIILHSQKGQGYVSVIHRDPKRNVATAYLKTSMDLAAVIRVLCAEPAEKDSETVGGLGVSYSQMIALVKQLSDKRAVQAEFRAGPPPKIGVNIKK